MNFALYCDVAEAARLAGVTDRHIRNAIKAGKIQGAKMGHVWMVLRSSAMSFERQPGMGRPAKARKKAAPRRRPAKR